MPSVTKVRCPACKALLHISVERLAGPIQCEHCSKRFRATPKSKSAPPPPLPQASALPPPPQPAADGFVFVPPAASAADVVDANLFAFDTAPGGGQVGPAPVSAAPYYRRSRPSVLRRVAVFGVVSALIATAVGAGFYFQGLSGGTNHDATSDTDPEKNLVTIATHDKGPAKVVDLPKAATHFPRRFLAVTVHNYLYANPVSARGGRMGLPTLLKDFAKDKLRVDPDQVYVLSDAAPGKEVRSPIKPVIEQTIEEFLATSRKQDRVLLVFVGHAVELDDQPYLVPLEGELTKKDTLVPLKWLYDKLAACPARQKVLIMDVCRDDTARGSERPGSGPMGPKLDAALANPPPGVQVLTACVAGQVSHEYDYATVGGFDVNGGAFLNLFTQATRSGWGIPKPEDPLPVGVLTDRARDPLNQLVASRDKAEQTPRLAGAEAANAGDGAAYAAGEPMPSRFEVPSPAAFAPGGLADPAVIRSIFAEVALPPIKLPRDADQVEAPEEVAAKLAAVVPFRADALKGYEADYASLQELRAKPREYPLRVAVIRAVEELEKAKLGLKDEFKGPTTDDVKRSLTDDQKSGPAKLEFQLREVLDGLEKAANNRDAEKSKRWQTHYDYVLAQVKARIAYVSEYNLMLAKAKRDELPPLDAKLHNGYRLASQEKLQSPKDVKDLASDAKKLVAKVIKENPGTPWEVLAKRDQMTALGLAWQPANLGK